MISIYGVRLNFTSNSDFFLKELMEDFKYFQPKSGRDSNSDANIFLQVVKDSESIPVNLDSFEEAKLVKEILTDSMAEYKISVFDNNWIIIKGLPKTVAFLINPEQEIYHGYSTVEDATVYHMLTDLIMNILTKQLIRRKICCVHAAAVSKNNSGILFPGKAGSGKTTLSIILTKSGFKFLADDYPIILGKNSDFEIFTLPLRLKVRPDTLKQFPEFQTYVREKGVQVERPFIDVTEIYSDCLVKKAKLKFIAFPILTSGPTDFKRISKEEALKKLIPCIFDPFPHVQKDTSIRKELFEIAYNLVNSLDCYYLFVGKDTNLIVNVISTIVN